MGSLWNKIFSYNTSHYKSQQKARASNLKKRQASAKKQQSSLSSWGRSAWKTLTKKSSKPSKGGAKKGYVYKGPKFSFNKKTGKINISSSSKTSSKGSNANKIKSASSSAKKIAQGTGKKLSSKGSNASSKGSSKTSGKSSSKGSSKSGSKGSSKKGSIPKFSIKSLTKAQAKSLAKKIAKKGVKATAKAVKNKKATAVVSSNVKLDTKKGSNSTPKKPEIIMKYTTSSSYRDDTDKEILKKQSQWLTDLEYLKKKYGL